MAISCTRAWHAPAPLHSSFTAAVPLLLTAPGWTAAPAAPLRAALCGGGDLRTEAAGGAGPGAEAGGLYPTGSSAASMPAVVARVVTDT